MDAKQLQSYKQHSTLLSQFIVRLSAFYEGLSDDLDKELQTLHKFNPLWRYSRQLSD